MSDTARQLAKRILREFQSGRHYRDIARDDFPDRRADGSQIVKPGTLCRIAKTNGKWMPKNKEILVALGVIRPPYPRPSWLFKWYRLPKEERHKVIESHVKTKAELKREASEIEGVIRWLE